MWFQGQQNIFHIGIIIQQDGAPPHYFRSARDYLARPKHIGMGELADLV